MTNRRTSNYTVTVPDATDAMLDRRAARLVALGRPVQDRQTHGLTFRAADDEDALKVLRIILHGDEHAVTLTTGLGVHRRQVN